MGVAILGGVLLISRIEDGRMAGLEPPRSDHPGGCRTNETDFDGYDRRSDRTAARSRGDGYRLSGPEALARVVVGGMLTAAFLILVVLPVLYEMVHRRTDHDE